MINVMILPGHKSYHQAPALCLARFDELTAIGLDAFTKRWDPYWDVPLNESLPELVIELLMVADGAGKEQQLRLGLSRAKTIRGL